MKTNLIQKSSRYYYLKKMVSAPKINVVLFALSSFVLFGQNTPTITGQTTNVWASRQPNPEYYQYSLSVPSPWTLENGYLWSGGFFATIDQLTENTTTPKFYFSTYSNSATISITGYLKKTIKKVDGVTDSTVYNYFNVSKDISVTMVEDPGTISAAPAGALTYIECLKTDLVTYSIPNVPHANSYNWTYPSGWTPQGAIHGSSITLQPSTIAGGTLTVRAVNTLHNTSAGGLLSNNTSSTTISRIPPPPNFTSPVTSVCLPASKTYTISPVPGAQDYIWSMIFSMHGPQGPGPVGPPGPPQLTYTTNFPSGGGYYDISVRSTNACGQSIPRTIRVDARVSPSTPVFSSLQLYAPGTGHCRWHLFVYGDRNVQDFLFTRGPNTNTMLENPSQDEIESGFGWASGLTNNTITVKARNFCGLSSPLVHTFDTPTCPDAGPSGLNQANNTAGIDDISRTANIFTVFPNPLTEKSTINYILEKNSTVVIEIDNIVGQKIATLVNDLQNSGEYSHPINLKDSGVYFIRMSVDGITKSQKILVN